MKVKELIEQLKNFKEDAYVYMPGYEGGIYSPTSVTAIKVKLNVYEEWYYGPHEIATEDYDEEGVMIR